MTQPRTAAPAVGAASAGGPGQAEPANKWLGIAKSVAGFLAIQTVMNYGLKYMGIGKSGAPATPATAPSAAPGASISGSSAVGGIVANVSTVPAEPAWELGTPISMLLYTSLLESPNLANIEPVVRWDGLTYGNYADVRAEDLLLDVPQPVRTGNASWYMDVVLVKDGGDIENKGPNDVALYRKQITRFLPKKRVRKEKKLIGGDETSTAEEEPDLSLLPKEIVAHWATNLTLTIISNGGKVALGQLHPAAQPHYQLSPAVSTDSAPKYFPPVFPNDFWLLRENIYPINATDAKLPLHVQYHAIGAMKFQMFASLGQGFEAAAASQGGGTGAEMDEVKRMLTETSPWLLVTTAIVTVLHMVFEFLAFSSDVKHWRKKDKDLVGVSLNTILTNCFVQLVILLYLQDSSEETSMMILFTQGIGLVIEAWKITKVTNVRIRPSQNIIGYHIAFEDKKVLSEDEKKTQEYDQLAFRIVSYFAAPGLVAYSVYSLMYQTHRSWYSFIVTTLAQAIYMFGFVQLIPQLIINYKLKSVAHMPMKAMVYKTLATVVDDFFAFCIRMPWLHRLACFRDDVVFVVLLYQRYIYRVDYSRINEFGQVAEGKVEPVGDVADVEGEKPALKDSKKTQ